MKMKKAILFLCAAAFSLTLCGCSSGQASTEEVVYIKLGHVNGIDSPNQIVAEKMNELLAERLPKYQLEIYPGGQLGGERDMIESVQLGTLDMTITATTPLTNFVTSMNVGELLYLIQDYDHADAVYQGDLGDQWLLDCSEVGMKGLGFTEVGFRMLCTNKPVESITDLNSLKLRVMENDMHVSGWRAMGCDAVTMSWADAYAGVQQGTIDAVEVPYTLLWSNSVPDICDYAAETNHIYTAQCMLMSDWALDKIDEEEQQIFKECSKEACAYGREYAREQAEICRQNSIDAGMTITEPDPDVFRQQAEDLYQQYEGEYGDLIREIKELAQ